MYFSWIYPLLNNQILIYNNKLIEKYILWGKKMKTAGKMTTKLFICLLVTALISGYAAAGEVSPQTWVYGKIYVQGTNTHVPGADVKVRCDSTEISLVSDSDGVYDTCIYDSEQMCIDTLIYCPIGANVTVSASKGGMSGTNSGIANYDQEWELNIGIVDVPILAPELVGALAAIAALAPGAAYLKVRRKK